MNFKLGNSTCAAMSQAITPRQGMILYMDSGKAAKLLPRIEPHLSDKLEYLSLR